MNVEDLPEEMLQQVFLALGQPYHLPTVALVCRFLTPPLFPLSQGTPNTKLAHLPRGKT
jgi:hypothetical protein